jgi:hypothetical protein
MSGRFVATGIPEVYSKPLAAMDTSISKGSEERLSDDVQKVTGRPPKTFRQFAEEKKDFFV